METLKIKDNKKYISKNPISRSLIGHFNKKLKTIISTLEFSNLVDIGCGEGAVLKILEKELCHKNCFGVDIDPENITFSTRNAPFCEYKVANIYNMPFRNNSFEVVMCLEVLEHLEKPERALNELQRICSRFIIISVPREPIWRVLNILRGKYWNKWGNTPGHINHYRSKDITKLVMKYFEIINVFKPLPWTIILGKKRD